MSFQELKRLLYKSGINLFPDKDAFCYCEGSFSFGFYSIYNVHIFTVFSFFHFSQALCEKDTIMEFHLYDCMAHLGLTHNFMWSRWNSQLNSRSMALLVREIIEKRKTVKYINQDYIESGFGFLSLFRLEKVQYLMEQQSIQIRHSQKYYFRSFFTIKSAKGMKIDYKCEIIDRKRNKFVLIF